MLALTNAAAGSIRELLADLPDGAGLRVSLERPGNGTEPEFALSVAVRPDKEDEIVEFERARVFVEPAVSSYLADKILDAEGQLFMFRPAA
jgi:Fe-S cluster assembly iron-binding protein IscA